MFLGLQPVSRRSAFQAKRFWISPLGQRAILAFILTRGGSGAEEQTAGKAENQGEIFFRLL
jgi:hypothetical protein